MKCRTVLHSYPSNIPRNGERFNLVKSIVHNQKGSRTGPGRHTGTPGPIFQSRKILAAVQCVS